jgi:hypothetical protein
MRRRLFCLLPLAILAACAETETAPVTAEPSPEPERVYSPGPIPWEQLSEEHRRRARMMLARHGEAVPEDEEALRVRWGAMSPAQQRFAIRAPSRMTPPRDSRSRRGTASRGGTRQATPSRSTPPRQGSSTTRPPTTRRPSN